MRRMNVPAHFRPLLASIALTVSAVFVPSHPAQAQTAPDAGTPVVVKMIDTIDSGSDPAGRQYRATVSKPVNAGNGVTIAQGSPATITLARLGSGYTAQLSSLSINGQLVAVTSNTASVSGASQYAPAKVASSINSVLGGFGHHVGTASAVAAVAAGQHVTLPTGTTLTFVLGQPPASGTTESAATTTPPAEATAAPSPSAAADATPGPPDTAPSATGHYVFCFTGQYSNSPSDSHVNTNEPTTYFSEVFPEPAIGMHVNINWNAFLEKHSMPKGACEVANGFNIAQQRKQQRVDEYRKEKKQVQETGWEFTPDDDANTHTSPAPTAAPAATAAAASPNAATAAAATTAANEYYVYCKSPNLDGPMYFSDIFAFNQSPSHDARDVSVVLAAPFLQFLEKKYNVKDASAFYTSASWSGSNFPTQCSQAFASLQDAQRDKQVTENNVANHLHRQVIETGWKTSTAPLAAATAPPAAANEYYISCFSDTALQIQYFSDIFAAPRAIEPIRSAFLAFLEKKYGFNDTRLGPHVDCDVSAKPGNDAMFKSSWAVRQNRVSLANVNKKQVVETGWKYTP